MATELSLIRIEVTNIGGSGITGNSPAQSESKMVQGTSTDSSEVNDSTDNFEGIAQSSLLEKGRLVGSFAKGLGLAGLNIAGKSVGTFTGNQALQNQLNNATQLANLGIAVAVSPGLAAAMMAYTIANNAINIAEKVRTDMADSYLATNRLGKVVTGSSRTLIGR